MQTIQTEEMLKKRLEELENFYAFLSQKRQFNGFKIENFDGEELFLKTDKQLTEDHGIIKFFRRRKNAHSKELWRLTVEEPAMLCLEEHPGQKGHSCFKIGFDMLRILMISGGEWTQEEYLKQLAAEVMPGLRNPTDCSPKMNPWYIENWESDQIVASKADPGSYADYQIILEVKSSKERLKEEKGENGKFDKIWIHAAHIHLNLRLRRAEVYKFVEQCIDGKDPKVKAWTEGE